LQENFRKGGYLRIYPSKNSNVYDKYFGNTNHTKMSNKMLHSLLFSEEIIPYQNRAIVRNFQLTMSRHQMIPSANSSDQSNVEENAP
jgi:hypothetical protein